MSSIDTQFGTGIASDDDSRSAGAHAAQRAYDAVDAERVDFCHVFCSVHYDSEAVVAGIRDVVGDDASLLGCSSSAEFGSAGVTEGGVAVALVTSDSMQFHTGLGTGLSESMHGALSEALADVPTDTDEFPHQWAIHLQDGESGVREELALATQQRLGPHVTFAGGSAVGAPGGEQPVVFCDGDVATDAVGIALVASRERPVITVNHGHRPVSGPMEVTAADGNVVRELDGRPAADVWREAAREGLVSQFDVDVDEFDADLAVQQRIMSDTGLAIDQGDGYKIRAPLIENTEPGAIAFSVGIPEGTVLRAMYGDQDDVIESARAGAAEAVDLADGREMAGAFVYDCACRRSILDDRYDEAVGAMDDALGVPFTGFATWGEMGMQMGQTSGFHNISLVTLLLPK